MTLGPLQDFDLPPGRLDAQRDFLVTEAAHQGHRHGSRSALRVTIVLAAIGATVLVVTPAFGIGSRILDLLQDRPPSPEEAQEQTGVTPAVHLATSYEGESWAVLTYVAPDGRLCVAERMGGAMGFGCFEPAEIFSDGPVWLSGPSAMQKSDAPGFDPTLWDRMWFSGLSRARVSRMEVVMTDCSLRPVPLDQDGVFLFTVPRADLHAGVWPYRLVSYDAGGAIVDTRVIRTDVPDTPQAREAGTSAPRPDPDCR